MRKFCRYAVIDLATGNLLVSGEKWKDFDNSNIRYVYVGTFITFPFFNKITEYFRTLEVNGNSCAIVYWAHKSISKRLYNCVTLSGYNLRLRARTYNLDGKDYPEVYGKLLSELGITL